MDDVLFWVLGVISVVAGIAVFRVDSMARASYALAISFVAVGLALLLFDLDYIGVIVVLMMVMEMAVMAVYMIMFMGMNPALMPMSMVHGHRAAITAGLGSFVVLVGGALLTPWPDRAGSPGADVTRELGEALMGSKMLAMLTISPVMLATIVAGVSLAAHRTRYDRLGDDLAGPAIDPQPGGVGRSTRSSPTSAGSAETAPPAGHAAGDTAGHAAAEHPTRTDEGTEESGHESGHAGHTGHLGHMGHRGHDPGEAPETGGTR